MTARRVPPIPGHNAGVLNTAGTYTVTGKMTVALVATVSFPRSCSQLLSRILFVTKSTLDPGNETRFTCTLIVVFIKNTFAVISNDKA